MKSFVRLVVAGALALAVTACSKAGEETAQKNTMSLVDQYNAINSEVEGMGYPSSDWSDAKLNEYEQKLKRQESLMRDLESADGDHGVVNNWFQSREALSARKSAVESARRDKVRLKAVTDQESAKLNRMEAAASRFKTAATNLKDMGTPNETWSREKLSRYLNAVNEVDSALDESQAANEGDYRLKEMAKKTKGDLATLRDLTTILIQLKDTPAPKKNSAA